MGRGVKRREDFGIGILGTVHVKLKARKLFTRGPWHNVTGTESTGAKNARRRDIPEEDGKRRRGRERRERQQHQGHTDTTPLRPPRGRR